MKKDIVYLSHPYGNKEENAEEIKQIMLNLYQNDWFFERFCVIDPVHAYGCMYTDLEYQRGLDACMDMLEYTKVMLVVGDWKSSTGCKGEIEYCKQHSIPYIIIDTAQEFFKYDPRVLGQVMLDVINKNQQN